MASWWLGSRLRSVIILMHVAVGEARVPQEPRVELPVDYLNP